MSLYSLHLNKNYRNVNFAFWLLLCVGSVEAGLKLYCLRHAEAGYNVEKDWKERKVAKLEWPGYVGDPKMFTPKGKEPLLRATEHLQNYKFDLIATSPMWRTRNTILSYLKVVNGNSEIRPVLYETSGSSKILSIEHPWIKKPEFGARDIIELPKELVLFFNLIEGGEDEFKGPGRGANYKYKFVAMKLVLTEMMDRVNERFADSDKSILLVGHGGLGKGLLNQLLLLLVLKNNQNEEVR